MSRARLCSARESEIVRNHLCGAVTAYWCIQQKFMEQTIAAGAFLAGLFAMFRAHITIKNDYGIVL